MKTSTFALTLALASLPLGACAGRSWNSWDTPRYEEHRTMSVAYESETSLAVVNANGSVVARSHDVAGETTDWSAPTVTVDAKLYSNNAERLALANLRVERQGDNSLRVWVEWPGTKRQNGEGASIDILTPGAVGVDVRTSNGRITAAGLSGHAELSSSNGSVTLEHHDGPTTIRTSNGAVRVDDPHHPVDIGTSNGSVRVSHAHAPVDVTTSNGAINVSTAGDHHHPVRVRTSNARVELNLGPAFEGRLRLGTSNGSINVSGFEHARLVESRKNYTEIVVGDSTEISAVQTSNGSIRVTGTEPSRD